MTAEIIPLRAAPRPANFGPLRPAPPAAPGNESLLAQACSEENFERSERAIIDATDQGDLRHAIILHYALVLMNLNPFTAKDLQAERDGRLAALLDHIEQAARRHYREAAAEETP